MIDINRLLFDYRIDYTPRADFLNVMCPYCRNVREAKPGLGFSVNGDACTCWKCGKHSVTDALQKVIGLTYSELQKILPEYSIENKLRLRLNKKQPQAKAITLPGGSLNIAERRYLKKRDFDPDYLVEKYKVHGGGIAGDYAYRIIIPFILRGQVVSFTARDITGQAKRKYMTESVEDSVMNPKTLLYNGDNAKKSRACLVEGPVDVWRMGDGFVAALGTSLSEKQVRELSRFESLFIMFDPEDEAQRRAKKYAEQIAAVSNSRIEIIDAETEGDPGSWTEEQAASVRKELGF